MARVPNPDKEIKQAEKAHQKEVAAINKRRAQQQDVSSRVRLKGQPGLADQAQPQLDRKHAEDLLIARKRRDRAVEQAKQGRPPLTGRINWPSILRGPNV